MSAYPNPSARPVLLVEDNPGDVRLTCEALRDRPAFERLVVVRDGEEALAYLRRQGQYAQAARPALIMLDLNLPRVDGRQVLNEIKQNPELRMIPVIILTSSESHDDISKAYHLHANCLITKPADFDEYIKVVRMIERFWLGVVELPPE